MTLRKCQACPEAIPSSLSRNSTAAPKKRPQFVREMGLELLDAIPENTESSNRSV
jgi:hypothetical protein